MSQPTYRNFNEHYIAAKEREFNRLKAANQRHTWLRKNEHRIRAYIKKNKELQDHIINQYLNLLAEQSESGFPTDLSVQYANLQRDLQ